MTRGVPKELSTKAQEQYDKQRSKVDRMINKRQALMAQVHKINDDLEDEITLLQYYSKHPLVEQPVDDGIVAKPETLTKNEPNKSWVDEELPLEAVQ